MPHEDVLELLRIRIDDDARGGAHRRHVRTYQVIARASRSMIAEHRPSTPARGTPCTACAEPWPCPPIHGVLED
jgi:hypothetical protein